MSPYGLYFFISWLLPVFISHWSFFFFFNWEMLPMPLLFSWVYYIFLTDTMEPCVFLDIKSLLFYVWQISSSISIFT